MRNIEKNIGSFMIAVGAIIELKGTDKILLIKRSDYDIKAGTWEMMYGRIGHHEELAEALKREIHEETGLQNIRVKKLNRIWHLYRGEKDVDNELFGFTFVCESDQETITLSNEHTEYIWVHPEDAISMIETVGVQEDLKIYMQTKHEHSSVPISSLDGSTQLF